MALLNRASTHAVLAVAASWALACGSAGPADRDFESVQLALSAADCPLGATVIRGTDGNDVLRGTSGNDCLLGFEGNDQLFGGGGSDFLVGGAGDDELDGEDGADTLHGELGEDVLFGGTENDRLFGGDASDVLFGEGGTDTANAEAGNDAIAPTSEIVNGGTGADSCSGTGCESSLFRACLLDGDCVAGSRCLRATACVSCQGDPLCRGRLQVTVGVQECAPGFVPGPSGACQASSAGAP